MSCFARPIPTLRIKILKEEGHPRPDGRVLAESHGWAALHDPKTGARMVEGSVLLLWGRTEDVVRYLRACGPEVWAIYQDRPDRPDQSWEKILTANIGVMVAITSNPLFRAAYDDYMTALVRVRHGYLGNASIQREQLRLIYRVLSGKFG